MSLKTPIAFIVFNRPEVTARVFARIAEQKPQRLLVIADGARTDRLGEAEFCAAVREIATRVTWPCEVYTNFSDVNLGCRARVSSGLDWVFTLVEEAIIIEDDCLPASSFFSFCREMLSRYRDDPRVAMISGNTFQPPQWMPPESYYFSKYTHIWGWATWRRAWKHYDVDMATWPRAKADSWLASMCEDPIEADFWEQEFDSVFERKLDTWDYQWLYAAWRHNSLAVLPAVNLISNLGFGGDATHTKNDSPLANLPVGRLDTLRHPAAVVRSLDADRYTFDHIYGGLELHRQRRFDRVVKRAIRETPRRAKRLYTKMMRAIRPKESQ